MKKCTMCGKEFDVWDAQENFSFRQRIGYGSAHDSDYLDLNLCCGCFDKVIDIITPMCETSPIKDSLHELESN